MEKINLFTSFRCLFSRNSQTQVSVDDRIRTAAPNWIWSRRESKWICCVFRDHKPYEMSSTLRVHGQLFRIAARSYIAITLTWFQMAVRRPRGICRCAILARHSRVPAEIINRAVVIGHCNPLSETCSMRCSLSSINPCKPCAVDAENWSISQAMSPALLPTMSGPTV